MAPNERQNTDDALILQATARFLYDKATRLDAWIWGLSIALPILKLTLREHWFLTLLLLLNFIASLFLDDFIRTWSYEAADYKLLFDKMVFGYADSDTDMVKASVNKARRTYHRNNSKFYDKNTQNDGNSNGVKDWYNNLDSTKDLPNQYRESQMETDNYDNKMSSYIIFSFLVAIIIILAFLLRLDMSLNDTILLIFVSFATLSRKIINTWLNLKREKDLCEKIGLILNKESITHEESTELMDLEDKKRRILLPIKGLFYPIIHSDLQKLWSKEKNN